MSRPATNREIIIELFNLLADVVSMAGIADAQRTGHLRHIQAMLRPELKAGMWVQVIESGYTAPIDYVGNGEKGPFYELSGNLFSADELRYVPTPEALR